MERQSQLGHTTPSARAGSSTAVLYLSAAILYRLVSVQLGAFWRTKSSMTPTRPGITHPMHAEPPTGMAFRAASRCTDDVADSLSEATDESSGAPPPPKATRASAASSSSSSESSYSNPLRAGALAGALVLGFFTIRVSSSPPHDDAPSPSCRSRSSSALSEIGPYLPGGGGGGGGSSRFFLAGALAPFLAGPLPRPLLLAALLAEPPLRAAFHTGCEVAGTATPAGGGGADPTDCGASPSESLMRTRARRPGEVCSMDMIPI